MNQEKFTIGTIVRGILLDDVRMQALIGNKIYPLYAPEGTIGDFIVYQRVRYGKNYTNMGVYQEVCYLYLAIVSDSYDRSQQIAITVNDILEGYTDKFQIKMSDSTEDVADNKFIQVLEFTID